MKEIVRSWFTTESVVKVAVLLLWWFVVLFVVAVVAGIIEGVQKELGIMFIPKDLPIIIASVCLTLHVLLLVILCLGWIILWVHWLIWGESKTDIDVREDPEHWQYANQRESTETSKSVTEPATE